MNVDNAQLSAYAELIVRGGLNLRAGQRLIIPSAPINQPEAVEAIVAAAYRAGAPLVTVLWSSDTLTLARLHNAPAGSLSEYPSWLSAGLTEAARADDAFLFLSSSDPELLSGEDPGAVSTLFAAASRNQAELQALRMGFQFSWNVAALPSEAWAGRVYPDLAPAEAEARLWEELFAFCRLDGGASVAAWRAHVAEIEARKRIMTEKAYRELHFEGPGTDLTVGLPERQQWNGGQVTSPAGTVFSPNIPTEEVFTMPHRTRVNGTVAATRPLHHAGMFIHDLRLRFEGGKVAEVSARTGQEQVERLIATDPGAMHLGEVALVSHDSPIAQTGQVYLNGLIDENAACHLALGRAYRSCVEGGEGLSDEDFTAAGGNLSAIHVDFMVGSDELDVSGLTAKGTVEPILRGGRWKLEGTIRG